MTRIPARQHYDVDIQIEGGEDKLSCFANAFIKFTYRIDPRSKTLKPANAVPLQNDLKDESLQPRLPPHSDYWPWKTYTDIGINGAAYVADGASAQQHSVSAVIGKRRRDIQVFGQRFIEFQRGKPTIGQTQPFTEQPLGLEFAYGGCDFRVPFDNSDPRAISVTLDADHPGLYPRNPWGTGYLAMNDPVDGMPLPLLEDPSDLLTNNRLIATSPEEWYRQPMPAHIGWVPVNCFPRNLFIAIECDPWFPPPDDAQLKEISLGHLAKGYRNLLANQIFGMEPHWRFHQEAVPDFMFKNDVHGAPVLLKGLHPEYPVIEFSLPQAAPVLKMKIEDIVENVQPFLTSVEITPDKELVTMTYTASMNSPRPFIPGIHKKIPVAISVNDEKAVAYATPPTLKTLLSKAKAEKGESQ
ncbi:MAG: DUF2169 domain-containing protein [Granulosicoccus sp.]